MGCCMLIHILVMATFFGINAVVVTGVHCIIIIIIIVIISNSLYAVDSRYLDLAYLE